MTKPRYAFFSGMISLLLKPKNYLSSYWHLYLRCHILITLTVGIILIIINTLWAFYTKPLHGDVVAQQLVVSQWMNGMSAEGFGVGPTNYILKLPIYAIIEGLFGWVEPFMRLVGTGLLLNIFAWVLCYLLTQKILTQSGVGELPRVIVSQLYGLIAMGAGGIFLLNYPNSRNIEIAFMLVLIYIFIRLLQQRRKTWEYAAFSTIALIAFVNDKYAMYVIGGSMALFLVGRLTLQLRHRQSISGSHRSPKLAAAGLVIIVGVVLLQQVVTIVLSQLTPIEVVWDPGTQFSQERISVVERLQKLGEAFIQNLGAPVIGRSWSMKLSPYLATLGLLTGLLISLLMLRKGKLPASKVALSCLMAVIVGVSIALPFISGMVSPRYLIIVPFALVILAAVHADRLEKHRLASLTTGLFFGSSIAILSFLFLYIPLLSTEINRNGWEHANREMLNIVASAQERGITKGYMTMQYAQPITYLTNGSLLALPIKCTETGELSTNRVLVEASTYDVPASGVLLHIRDGEPLACLNDDTLQSQTGYVPTETLRTNRGKTIFYEQDIRRYLISE